MRRSSAFTLVELLVVISIIGVLVALLLPAVQAARESGRRATCQNHLRQLGIAMHSYHDAHQQFPRGGWNPRQAAVSWTSELLPWLEQQTIYDRLDRTEPYTSARNQTVASHTIELLLCPSKPNPRELRPSADLPASSMHRFAPTCYGGIQGERALRAPNARNQPERGVMIYMSEISLVQITDGTSQTAMIGEVPEGIHSLWMSVRNLFDQSAPINTRSGPNTTDFTDFGQELSSHHPGGAHALLADGAVRFLHESTDNLALSALCSRSAGD